jgi:hypothetical protein
MIVLKKVSNQSRGINFRCIPTWWDHIDCNTRYLKNFKCAKEVGISFGVEKDSEEGALQRKERMRVVRRHIGSLRGVKKFWLSDGSD